MVRTRASPSIFLRHDVQWAHPRTISRATDALRRLAFQCDERWSSLDSSCSSLDGLLCFISVAARHAIHLPLMTEWHPHGRKTRRHIH